MSLNSEQIARYRDNGFVDRVRVLPAERAAAYAERLLAFLDEGIAVHGDDWRPAQIDPNTEPDHPLAAAFTELGTAPPVLDAVESLLGPHLLIRNADVFVKTPGSDGVLWHLDTAMTSPDTDAMLSAFIALTETTPVNGCLEFSAGTHRRTLDDAPTSKTNLTLSDRAVASLRDDDLMVSPLSPGEMSLHHIRTAHRSDWNRSTKRRVAFVLRFVSPAVKPSTAESGQATLVRGTRTGRFSLRPKFPVSWLK